jgi:tripartite-type tricarboxylate transporter receptor subunit TctC
MLRRLSAAAGGAVLAVSMAASSAVAQQWPSGPVTLIIPFAAGGPTDVLGRIVGERMQKSLGQQVVIENVGGAGGMTGSSRVAKARPDGNTFGIGTVGTHAQNQSLFAKPAYDASSDFEPVILIAQVPIALLSKTGLPGNDLASFIAHAKANQGKLNFASAGAGSATHLACVLFNAAAGIQAAHVPYKGTGPAMNDIVGGQVDYICEIMSTTLGQIQAKSVKAIALFNMQRSSVLPDLKTADEQGLKGFEAYTWNGIFTPKGVPAPILARLNAVVSEAMDDPSVAKRLTDLGAAVVGPEKRTPAYLAGFVKSEIEKWAKPIKESGAKVE